jgi:hypothetical protein
MLDTEGALNAEKSKGDNTNMPGAKGSIRHVVSGNSVKLKEEKAVVPWREKQLVCATGRLPSGELKLTGLVWGPHFPYCMQKKEAGLIEGLELQWVVKHQLVWFGCWDQARALHLLHKHSITELHP